MKFDIVLSISGQDHEIEGYGIQLFEYKLKSIVSGDVVFVGRLSRSKLLFVSDEASARKIREKFASGKILKVRNLFVANIEVKTHNTRKKPKTIAPTVISELRPIASVDIENANELMEPIPIPDNPRDRKGAPNNRISDAVTTANNSVASARRTILPAALFGNGKGRILLLDSDARFISSCALYFRSRGLEFLSVNVVSEAVREISRRHYDCLILDFKSAMESMASLLAACGSRAEIPEIVLTTENAKVDSQILQEMEKIGISLIFIKPLILSYLFESIQDAMAMKKAKAKPSLPSTPGNVFGHSIASENASENENMMEFRISEKSKTDLAMLPDTKDEREELDRETKTISDFSVKSLLSDVSNGPIATKSTVSYFNVLEDLTWELSKKLDFEMSKEISSGVKVIIMDLTNVKFLSSAAIGAIMYNMRIIGIVGGDFYVISSNEYIKNLFEMLGFDKMLFGKLYDDKADLLSSLDVSEDSVENVWIRTD